MKKRKLKRRIHDLEALALIDREEASKQAITIHSLRQRVRELDRTNSELRSALREEVIWRCELQAKVRSMDNNVEITGHICGGCGKPMQQEDPYTWACDECSYGDDA